MMSTAQRQSRQLAHPRRAVALAGAVLALGLVAAPAEGRSLWSDTLRERFPSHASLVRTQAADIGKSAAANAAATATGGRVLNVKRADGSVYFVKVLMSGGKLRVIKVDARSGKVQ